MLKERLKLLFHRHDYAKVGFEEVSDAYTRYSIREYQCTICHKTKKVDGRYDRYCK